MQGPPHLAVARLATGLISEGTAVASALTEGRAPKWSEGLMWASAGLGLAAAGMAGLSFLNNYKISRRIYFSPQNGSTAIRTGMLNTILYYLVRPACFLQRPAYFF